MTLSRLPRWFWRGLLLIVAATAAVVTIVLRFDTRDTLGGLVSVLGTVVTAGASAVGWLWKQAQAHGAVQLPLERAADELAKELQQQWERAATERGLTSAPIPVQWQWSPRQVNRPIAEAVGGSGGRRFAPLPEMAPVTVADLQSGELKDLLRVYGGLGSGRLIILGEPGAGKSGAGIRLLRDALAHRAALTAKDRVPVPVPVTPQGWDPNAERFAEWLAGSLAREYALLRAPEYGEDAAMRLITGGHLAVILDGLDEMPEALRPVALRELDKQATFRLVVLTRTQELVDAVSGDHLRGAAALELRPIDARQAAKYLASDLIDPPPAPWQHVTDHLRERPTGVLAQALTTPLMLTLLRDAYGDEGKGVDELIDGCRFPTREAVEDHLLDQMLTAAYTQHPGRPVPYTVDQARRWLGQLARRMNEEGTNDLAWWRIPRWMSAWPRVVVTVVVMGLISALLVWFVAGPIAHMHLSPAFQAGPLNTLKALFARGLGYAFMVGLGLLLVSPPGEGSPPQRERPWWSRTDILMILLCGAGVGVGSGLQNALWGGSKYGFWSGLKYGLVIGLVSSVVVGLGFVLGGGPPQRLGWLQWSRTDTRRNLRTGLVIGLVAGFVAGLGYGIGYGLKSGLEYGFLVGIGYLLVILVGGRTSPQLSQLRWSRTSTPTTLLIGLIIVNVSTGGYGIIYVLIVMLGGRPSLQRSQLRWSRTATPITLLIGLVAGPTLWLWNQLTQTDNSATPYTLTSLVFALTLGLGFGVTAGLLLGPRPSMEATNPLDPQSLWRRERQAGIVAGIVVGLVVGLVYGIANGIANGIADGLVAGLGSGLVSSATWAAVLASTQLWRRGEAPVRLLPFLDDARQRQILRTVGPVYQFWDVRLQNRLAAAYDAMPGEATNMNVVPA